MQSLNVQKSKYIHVRDIPTTFGDETYGGII